MEVVFTQYPWTYHWKFDCTQPKDYESRYWLLCNV